MDTKLSEHISMPASIDQQKQFKQQSHDFKWETLMQCKCSSVLRDDGSGQINHTQSWV